METHLMYLMLYICRCIINTSTDVHSHYMILYHGFEKPGGIYVNKILDEEMKKDDPRLR